MPAMHRLIEDLTDTHRVIEEGHADHVSSALAERQASEPDAAQALTGAPPQTLSGGADDGAG